MGSTPSSPANFDDVRMRGFRHRTTVAAALEWVDRQAVCLGATTAPLSAAAGRVLATDVTSDRDVPAFRRAMMDGYAVQAADTFGASAYNPLQLKVVGQVLPGEAGRQALGSGEAIRIMTGAPLPAGADAVLPAEKAQAAGESLRILDAVAPEKHVGDVGEDIARGTCVLRTGRVLRPQDLGVLSSLGVREVPVVRQPVVRLVITGNELVAAGQTPADHETVDANSPMLGALVDRDGGKLAFDGIAEDTPEVIAASLLASGADVVLVSGGSSVGQEDHAPQLVAKHGELAIHGIAMRPSSPAGMGRIGERLVFLLPGNPVSCLCAYDFFAGRAIRRLAGRDPRWPYRSQTLPLQSKLSSVVGRQDYARVRINDAGTVEPIAIGGASVLSSTSRADGFVIVPTDSEGFASGSPLEVFLYD